MSEGARRDLAGAGRGLGDDRAGSRPRGRLGRKRVGVRTKRRG